MLNVPVVRCLCITYCLLCQVNIRGYYPEDLVSERESYFAYVVKLSMLRARAFYTGKLVIVFHTVLYCSEGSSDCIQRLLQAQGVFVQVPIVL